MLKLCEEYEAEESLINELLEQNDILNHLDNLLSRTTEALDNHFNFDRDIEALDTSFNNDSIRDDESLISYETTHVIPLTLNEEQRNNRRIYSIKLSDFPTGTSARDLHDIIAAPEQLQGLSYAYMNCETDEDLFNATAKDYNFLLVWRRYQNLSYMWIT
ncbi:1514_t:CDS:2 [Entrophospora sp. SA101]|nr:1514_t:CDS:2 [Entrophospora sp. SA101]